MKIVGFTVLAFLVLLVNSTYSASSDKQNVEVMNLGTDEKLIFSEVEVIKEGDMESRRLLKSGGSGGGSSKGGGSGGGGGAKGGGTGGGGKGGGTGGGGTGGGGTGGGRTGGGGGGGGGGGYYGGRTRNDSNDIGTPSAWMAALYLFSVFAFWNFPY